MDYQVSLTPLAQQDWEEIYRYSVGQNPAAALQYCRRLLAEAKSLKTFPRRGRMVSKRRNIRRIICSPYVIYYRIHESRREVEILRFWHAARNPKRLRLREAAFPYGTSIQTSQSQSPPQMNPTVDLSCGDYFGLILPRATGVVFTNQTGGHACDHPKLERIFIPLDDGVGRPTRHVLQRHFSGSWATLTLEDATVIETALRKGNLSFIRVDETMLSDSVEAWVHVRLDWQASSFLAGFDPNLDRGILTWQNSD